MISLVALAAVVMLLGTLLLSNITDTSASIANISIQDNELAPSTVEANIFPVSATITISWQTAPLPDE